MVDCGRLIIFRRFIWGFTVYLRKYINPDIFPCSNTLLSVARLLTQANPYCISMSLQSFTISQGYNDRAQLIKPIWSDFLGRDVFLKG